MNAVLVAARDARVASKLLLLSILGLVLVGYLVSWGYPEFRERMLTLGKHAPKFVRKAMEARTGTISFEGFAGFAFIHPVTLALMALWPITRAVRAVAGDLERGALGWMLAYPVGRTPFILARAAVMLAGVVVLHAALVLALRAWGAWFRIEMTGLGPYLNAAVGGCLLWGAVGALTLWVSAASVRAVVPGFAGAGIVMGSMVFEHVGAGTLPLIEKWRWLSLFHYYDSVALMRGAALEAGDMAVLAGVMLVGLIGATVTFARRDLPV